MDGMFDDADEAERERDNLREVVDEDTGELVVVSNQMSKGHKLENPAVTREKPRGSPVIAR